MIEGYYEPHSRILLQRPVVLAGQLACGARLIGRTLSARTGLPFAEIDRLIEHDEGRSLARIAVEDGMQHLTRLAYSALQRLAARRPFGVIVLDQAWPPLRARDDLRRRTDFVHIQRPAEYLLARWELERNRSGRWMLGDHGDGNGDEESLRSIFDRRAALLAEAKILLEAGAQHEHRMAEILIDWLEPSTLQPRREA